MTFALTEIFLAGAIFMLLFYWWTSQGIKQIALQAAKAYCNQKDLQLLDDSMVLSRISLKRNQRGNLQLFRRFRFEFTSTGEQRYQGSICLLGNRVLDILVDIHRL